MSASLQAKECRQPFRNCRYTPGDHNRNQAQLSCRRPRMRRCNIFRPAVANNYKRGSYKLLSRLPWNPPKWSN